MLHFVHVRKRITKFIPIFGTTTYRAESSVTVKGGNTVAYVFNDSSKRLIYSTARCSKKDNYCKSLGRSLAAARLTGSNATGTQLAVDYSSLPEGKPTYKNISAYFNALLQDA